MNLQSYLLQVFAVASFIFFACEGPQEHKDRKAMTIEHLSSPAGQSTMTPDLFTAPDGSIYLSWVEELGERQGSMWFARWEGTTWSQPKMIASGDNWFLNWADYPSIAVNNEGVLTANWRVYQAVGKFALSILVSQSPDGENWSEPFLLHEEGPDSEHGFASVVSQSDGRFFATWLDGRYLEIQDDVPVGGAMTLRSAVILPDGQIVDRTELDHRVCDCCTTDAVMMAAGPMVVYRDRSELEMRDITMVQKTHGNWSNPAVVFRDNWKINGCPVNGPAIDAIGDEYVVAWYTNSGGTGLVNLSFSSKMGLAEPIRVSRANPVGRVDVILMEDKTAVITWVESVDEGAEIRACRYNQDGHLLSEVVIAKSDGSRASGFPVLARGNDAILVAWTETEPDSQVKTARIAL